MGGYQQPENDHQGQSDRRGHQICKFATASVLANILTIIQEDGVNTAIQCIYRDMEYAKTLIKRKDGKIADDSLEDSEESWTFIGDENDPDLVKRIHDWESMAQSGILSRKSDILSESEASSSGMR